MFDGFGGPKQACECPNKGASPWGRLVFALALVGAILLAIAGTARADTDFSAFLAALWPEAQKEGVSRATFDRETRGLTPDYSLPDLVLPGRPTDGAKGQAEFTRAPADYLDKTYLTKLAAEGRTLLAQHKATLQQIEKELGVDRYSVLAIWGRETAFGKHKLPHDALRVLATQAFVGRRPEMFRTEFIAALKMIEAGVKRQDMRASWAGAVGLTQFMPSEYFTHAYDLDKDGRKDIFHSVPDALGSAARQLQGKGWVAGQVWGHEVLVPPTADCSLEGPTQSRALREWVSLGFRPATRTSFRNGELKDDAYLMMPAGAYGPAFLVFENYKVIRRYNTSDLYAVFVGNLADRIAGGGDFRTPFGGTGAQRTAVIEEIQRRLKAQGYDVEKIDGKIGSNTRKVIGSYQRANRLKVDCWPTEAVLKHLQLAAAAR